MKRLLLTLLSFCILLPLPGPATLDGAPKQGGNANSKKKKTPAQKKKEEEQRKKARERAEAERKRRAQEEMKRKQAIEAFCFLCQSMDRRRAIIPMKVVSRAISGL